MVNSRIIFWGEKNICSKWNASG